MAEKNIAERLQPSLLDRLTDDEPTKATEGRDSKVIDVRRLREIVLRDLTWLFNTTAHESVQDLDRHPAVRDSTVNYGVPDIAGIAATADKAGELQRALVRAVRVFEPRINPESLEIRPVDEEDNANRAIVAFDIRGELWAHPMPIELYMRTELDVTSGDLTIRNQG